MSTKLKRFLKRVTKNIVDGYNPDRIILFGSSVNGEMNEDSDVDLCVIKSGIDNKRNRAYEVRKFLYNYDYPMDIIVFTPSEIDSRLKENDYFISDIVNDGKILYKK